MNDYQITTERVDDVPLLLAQMERMGIADAIDAHVHGHGNRQGLSYGWLAVVWLTHILSQADHRMNQVRDWVTTLVTTLTTCLPVAWRPVDCTDDRLADLLRALSDDTAWAACEATLNQTLLRTYALESVRVRLDSTTSSGFWDVTDDGLFQVGHRKDHRPDLAQVKAMLASLDPLGMPLAMDVVPGNRADDGLYWPIIQRVQTSLGRTGLLFIGDSKLAHPAHPRGHPAGGQLLSGPAESGAVARRRATCLGGHRAGNAARSAAALAHRCGRAGHADCAGGRDGR